MSEEDAPRDKSRGTEALNRDFSRYEQVVKDQRYRLSEREGEERFDPDFRIQTVSLGAFEHGDGNDRARAAERLSAALAEIGFAVLVDHGVDPALFERAADWTRGLFETTPVEDKLRFRARRRGSVNQGYFPIEETTSIHPDLVEGWVFCRRAFDLPGARPTGQPFDPLSFWPTAEWEGRFRTLVLALESRALPVMRAILTGLDQDPHSFDARLTPLPLGLRLNYYPPLTPDQVRSGAGRLLGHEDVTVFTLLPAPETEGLQVLNRKNGCWVRLDAPPGSIILNTGDYMQRMSNDRLKSTTHRVSKPRDPALCARPRVSFPLNVYLWEDDTLRVLPGLGEPRYAPVRALEFHTRITSKYYGDDYAVRGGSQDA